MRGHPVFIAQHATATCCRKCIQKWHGIEKGRAPNEKVVDYVEALIMGWIVNQLDKRLSVFPKSDNLSTNETYLCAIRNKTGKKIFSNHITLHKLDRQRY
jgi:hypothetical protein